MDDETLVVSQQRTPLRGQQKDAPGKTVFVAFSSLNLFDEIKVIIIYPFKNLYIVESILLHGKAWGIVEVFMPQKALEINVNGKPHFQY